MTSKPITLAPATVDPRILRVRGIQVLVDADLAEIYGVSTKALNQAVKRNAERFPEDFRFQLTAAEREEVVTNCDHLTRLKFSPVLPWAFTEHGSIMAASVLNSQHALGRRYTDPTGLRGLAWLRRLTSSSAPRTFSPEPPSSRGREFPCAR